LVLHRGWEIFLDITYSEEEFNLEIERLTNFDGNRELWFDLDCVLFNYPTYICTYYARGFGFQKYEYIIVDESNHRLVYIYLYCPGRKWYLKKHFREIVVPLEYQPKNYFSNKKEETYDGYYFSIYAREQNLIWFD